MNFYKRHLGDIAKGCAHLSQGAMGAYDLLLDWLYGNEKPLPADRDTLHRIGRATNASERANVDRVVAEFFVLTDAGYTQKRAGKEIAKANSQADTNRRIAEEREARRRARTEHEPLNEPSNDSCTNRQPSQTPDYRQELLPSDRSLPTPPSAGLVGVIEEHESPQPATNPAAAMAVALNRAGFRCTSLNPDLIAYAEAGGTVDHLQQLAALPECKGKPAAYLVRIARRELTEAAKPIAQGEKRSPGIAPHNPGGVSPRLSPEEEAARKADALALMQDQMRRLGHAA